jgi:sugar/nucleoside kinase (ribokinase family)
MSGPVNGKKFNVTAIGALCVDASVAGDDELLARHGLVKAASNDVGAAGLERITADPGLPKTAGSPGANVAMGISLRGGKAALVGKIANDEGGNFLAARLQSFDIDYTPVIAADAAKGTTLVMVVTTEDKERTFACYNGAGLDLMPEDIDEKLIRHAAVVYLDSYLWLSESGRETVQHAAALAKQSGALVALSLNDAGIVAANREAFLELARSHADILLGDRKEFMALLGTQTWEETEAALKNFGRIASVTAGAKGAHIFADGEITHVPALKIGRIVDTSGAGDSFAAGFLYGISEGKSPADSARQGAAWAAAMVQQAGAEPKVGKNAPQAPQKPPATGFIP